MTIFQPIWISTDEHLQKFFDIYKHSSVVQKLLGTYDLPPAFPYVHMYWGIIPWYKIPVVAIASGTGKIENNKFVFKSKPFHPFGSITKNLLDLEFELTSNECLNVSDAKASSPIIQYYSIPFTRIQTNRIGLLSNFLACVGGNGPSMEKIKEQSNELFLSFQKLASSRSAA